MATTSGLFRLFISSSFADFRVERDALQRVVFPHLRELCARRGCRFQPVDLRWGVTEEAGEDQQTMSICLQELRRCQQLSQPPHLLVLLGERYGWRPLPAVIPARDFETFLAHLAPAEQRPLQDWYERDDNAVPPHYRLRPRSGAFLDPATWSAQESELHVFWLRAVEAVLPLDDPRRVPFTASATHQEILAVQDLERTALCYLRQVQALPLTADSRDYVDLRPDGTVDADARRRVLELRAELERRMPPDRLRPYSASWPELEAAYSNPVTGEMPPWLQAFCVEVERDLTDLIEEQIHRRSTVPVREQDRQAHWNFAEERAQFFAGRQEEQERIARYLQQGAGSPLVLFGPSGCGKTALLGKAALDLRDSRRAGRVILRHVGVVPSACDVRSLLIGLCEELADLAGFQQQRETRQTAHPGEDARGKREAIEAEYRIPEDVRDLPAAFQRFLKLLPENTRATIILDSLDQLTPAHEAWSLEWLPRSLPAHVKLIVSLVEGGTGGECLEAARRLLPAEAMVSVGGLSPIEGEQLLGNWLADVGRTLQEGQRQAILASFAACPRPLFLKLAFEEARNWRSWEGVPVMNGSGPLPADLHGMLHRLFVRLERESAHGRVLVAAVLRRLGASRQGLTDDEMLGLLSADPAVMADWRRRSRRSPELGQLPPILWSRLYFDLAPYLTERRADETTVLAFYHRQAGEAAAARYLNEESTQRETHGRLADYFGGLTGVAQPHWFVEGPDRRQPNQRKSSEWPYHLVRAGRFEELLGALGELGFLEAKAESDRVPDLLDDLEALVLALPTGHPERKRFELLAEAVRIDLPFLTQYPWTLFQCLWNRCWWHDCPEAERHYDPPVGGWGPEGPPWRQPGLQLYHLLEAWRTAKEKEQPGFLWVRTLRPLPDRLGGAVESVRPAFDRWDSPLALSADGRRMVCTQVGGDSNLLWDVENDRPLLLLPAPRASRAAFASDGRLIALGSGTAIKLHEAESGALCATLTPPAKLGCLAFSTDNRLLAAGGDKGQVFVWDIASGQLLSQWQAHDKSINDVGFFPDGDRLVTGGGDGVVAIWSLTRAQELSRYSGVRRWLGRLLRFWDPTEGMRLARWGGHGKSVDTVAVAPAGDWIAFGTSDHFVGLWTVGNQRCQKLAGHMGAVGWVAFSPAGELISASADRTVRVWDPNRSVALACMEGHMDEVTLAALLPGGERAVSVGSRRDSTIRTWRLKVARTFPQLHAHGHQANPYLAFSPNGRWLVTSGLDQSVYLWDAESGERLAVCRGFDGVVGGVGFDSQGLRLVTGGSRNLRVWNVPRVLELARRGLLAQWLGSLARCWQPGGGAAVLALDELSESYVCTAFSPDGLHIAGGSYSNLVRIWDAGTGKEVTSFRAHKGKVEAIAYAAHGGQLVTASDDDKAIRLWDTHGWKKVREITLPWIAWLLAVRLSADGQRVLIRGPSETRCWNVTNGAVLSARMVQEDLHALGDDLPHFFWFEGQVGLAVAHSSNPRSESCGCFTVRCQSVAASPRAPVWGGMQWSSPHVFLFQVEGGKQAAEPTFPTNPVATGGLAPVTPAPQVRPDDVPEFLWKVQLWWKGQDQRLKSLVKFWGGLGALVGLFWGGEFLGILVAATVVAGGALALHFLTILGQPGLSAVRSLPESIQKATLTWLHRSMVAVVGVGFFCAISGALLTPLTIYLCQTFLGMLFAEVAQLHTWAGWQGAYWFVNAGCAGAIVGGFSAAAGGLPSGVVGGAMGRNLDDILDSGTPRAVLGQVLGLVAGVSLSFARPLIPLPSVTPADADPDNFFHLLLLLWRVPELSELFCLLVGLGVGSALGVFVGVLGWRNGMTIVLGGCAGALVAVVEPHAGPLAGPPLVAALIGALGAALAGWLHSRPWKLILGMAGTLAVVGAAGALLTGALGAPAGGALTGAGLAVVAALLVRGGLAESLQGILGGAVVGVLVAIGFQTMVGNLGGLWSHATVGASLTALLSALTVIERRAFVEPGSGPRPGHP